ncbi:MAG TPA: 50S ribosomal protein L4 [Gemmatimonadales bacterium]|nr:50S ribosomal protein L4 [Gemmatimonadales bacterium]
MLEAPHFTAAGARREAAFALPADYFDGTVNEPAMHRAVTALLNNRRQGTHATKTRGFVSGGNQKPWRQKGTGRARQGSIRAPHWRGGGTVFGPQPRDYTTGIPRKLRQLARRSALNARAREGALYVVERFGFTEPKTARLVALLERLGLAGRKVLILTRGVQENVYLSGRNVPTLRVMNYADASAYDVLWSDAVVVEEGALTGVEPAPLPAEETAPAPVEGEAAPTRAKAAKTAAKRAATAAKAPKAAKRGAKGEGAAKKPAAKPSGRKKEE